MYLLEVRNAEWTRAETVHFAEFMEFLIEWTYEKVFKKNDDQTLDFIFNHGFNILRNSFIEGDGRGMKCALQDYMFLRLGDLSWVPCHRTSYDQFIFGQFTERDGKINGFSSTNADLIPAIYSMKGEDMPYCENCVIKELCPQGCLGSQYETTGDLFSAIPTVCELEHAKIFAIIKALRKHGLFEKALKYVPESRREAFKRVSEWL
jgi:radical SAM protein with 4Fe4S-binding SPASM domain